MKKAGFLILGVVVLVTGIFSCKKSESASAAQGGKVEIICMVQSSPEAQFVKSVANAYMTEPGNENITVIINELGRDNVFPRIQNQLFTKSDGVDFFFVTPSLIGSLAEGLTR